MDAAPRFRAWPGQADWSTANQQLADYQQQGVLDDAQLTVSEVLPVCAGPPDMGNTLFVLVRDGLPNAGQVVWLDGEEIDRFDDFHQFITAMLNYTRADVEKLSGASGQPSDQCAPPAKDAPTLPAFMKDSPTSSVMPLT